MLLFCCCLSNETSKKQKYLQMCLMIMHSYSHPWIYRSALICCLGSCWLLTVRRVMVDHSFNLKKMEKAPHMTSTWHSFCFVGWNTEPFQIYVRFSLVAREFQLQMLLRKPVNKWFLTFPKIKLLLSHQSDIINALDKNRLENAFYLKWTLLNR